MATSALVDKIKTNCMKRDSITPPKIPDMPAEIWALIRQIPEGHVSTYGDVARALGDVGASRLVGEIMMRHDHNESCVCHRLVRADGSMGKFVTGDPREKALRLMAESVVLENDRVSLDDFRHSEFQCDAPLTKLKKYQQDVSKSVDVLPSYDENPKVVGGVDVSFIPNSSRGVAAYVVVNLEKREVEYSRTFEDAIRFPYISGYLAFRELPLLQSLLREVKRERELPDITLVDGSGVLHPRRAGVATMLGVAMGIRTIGITKKHLIGEVDSAGLPASEAREIFVDTKLSGYVVLPRSGTSKPIYVSPGHMIDAVSSLSVLRRCLRGRRLPEPIYWADRISRAATK